VWRTTHVLAQREVGSQLVLHASEFSEIMCQSADFVNNFLITLFANYEELNFLPGVVEHEQHNDLQVPQCLDLVSPKQRLL
jgi:hypothetical protein